MPSTVLGQYGITLPADTTANRPSPTTGMIRYNTTVGATEYYNGSAWVLYGYPGDSSQNPASSAVQIFNAGIRGKGFFWLTSPNGGVVRNFCDLDTLDEDGVAGWILVAQFPSGDWRASGRSTRSTLNPLDISLNINAQNDYFTRQWSANWGDYSINKFRVQFSDFVGNTATHAYADWYYHWTTATSWKTVWQPAAGTGNNWTNGTTNNNAYNINAFPGWPTPQTGGGAAHVRGCLKGFNWAYNLRFSYQVAQRWNGLNDASADQTASNTTYDFWSGLTTPDYSLGWTINGDGSLAILPQGATTSNTAGQDCTINNSKLGYDDDLLCLLWATTATQEVGQTGTTDLNRCMFFWVK
jgi:hypothetical protein